MICDIHKIYMKRLVAGVLVLMLAIPPAGVRAQAMVLPKAGEKVSLSQPFTPSVLSAMTVDPNDPLQLRFFVSQGLDNPPGDRQEEYLILVKDFMTALTVPEDQLWVNLSPYEKDRLIDERFGLTGMGRDLLGQDYVLKQVTASLLFPEEGVGKKFWEEVYARAQDEFGTTDIPVDTFNKVWIMPDVAEVYQQGASAMVLKTRLKVMLESDYLAAESSAREGLVSIHGQEDINAVPANEITKAVMREIIIPVLEKEVNEGKNFARLRQIYHALILAAWYKKSMKDTLLGRVYADKSKVRGIEQDDPVENQRIWAQYVEAFRKGAFNYIKEEVDRYSGETIPRKYLSGGWTAREFSETTLIVRTDRESIDFSEKTSSQMDQINATLEKSGAFINNIRPSFVVEDHPRFKEILANAQEMFRIRNNPGQMLHGKAETRFYKLRKSQQGLVKQVFREFIEKERYGLILQQVFDAVVDDENETGLQSLVLSGVYTRKVFEQFRGLSLFSNLPGNVPYEQVLEALGLESEMIGLFKSIDPLLKTDMDYEVFLAMLEEDTVRKIAEGSKFPSDNIYVKRLDGNDDEEALIMEREKDPEFITGDGSFQANDFNGFSNTAYDVLKALQDLSFPVTGIKNGEEVTRMDPVQRLNETLSSSEFRKSLIEKGRSKKLTPEATVTLKFIMDAKKSSLALDLSDVRLILQQSYPGLMPPRIAYVDEDRLVPWVNKMTAKATGLLAVAFDYIQQRVMGSKERAADENLIFGRAKSPSSSRKKADAKDSVFGIHDWLGNRLAVADVTILEKIDRDIMDGSIWFHQFMGPIREKEKRLMGKGPLTAGNLVKLLELRAIRHSFDHHKKVLVRVSNTFNKPFAVKWYKAVHYVFMLGDGLWTLELQLKTLLMSILHDLEHKLKYKAEWDNSWEFQAEEFKDGMTPRRLLTGFSWAGFPEPRHWNDFHMFEEEGLPVPKGTTNIDKLNYMMQDQEFQQALLEKLKAGKLEFPQGKTMESYYVQDGKTKLSAYETREIIEKNLLICPKKVRGLAQIDGADELYADLVKYIGLANAVELANYAYKKDRKTTLKALEGIKNFLMKDEGGGEGSETATTENAQNAETDKAEYGGIDVRDVNGALAVKGERVGFNADVVDAAVDAIDGLSPRIMSIKTVDGLPFLKGSPSS